MTQQFDAVNFEINIDRPPSLRDRVYAQLRDAIITGALVPGTTLLQEQLAEQIGVSRTPVRDALDRLAGEGLVTRGTGSRVYVAELSFQELREKYAVRRVLEGLALRLACENIEETQLDRLQRLVEAMGQAVEEDDFETVTELGGDFHDTIIASCGNEYLIQTLRSLNDSIRRYRRVAANIPGRSIETVHEHENVLRAIERGDVEAADRFMQQHIATSQHHLETAIKQYEKNIADGQDNN